MTDAELIAKKRALIETYVRELRTLADPFELLARHGFITAMPASTRRSCAMWWSTTSGT